MHDSGSTSDVFQLMIQQAVEAGLQKILNAVPPGRRLLSAEDAATYLSLSKREIYNMMATRELDPITHGRRKMLDIVDLDKWINRNKLAA